MKTHHNHLHSIWESECRIFCRYLLGQEMTDYVCRKYIDFHSRQASDGELTLNRLDALLLRVARASVWGTHLADTYATQFFRNATLRKKLVLAVALLECAPPGSDVIDRTFAGGRLLIGLRLCWHGILTVVMLIVATAIFGPAGAFFRCCEGDHARKAR